MIDEQKVTRRHVLKGLGALAAAGLARPALAADTTPPPGATPGTAAGSRVKFAITVNQGAPFEQILSAWEAAEAAGFDAAFVFDHFMGIMPGTPEQERHQEAWTLLAALAARTRRLRVGLLVNSCTYRHPAIVAKMAATVDQISGGRLILGLGAGWMEREHKAYGIPFHTKAGRARRLGEYVEVINALFVQERVTYSGKYFQLKDAVLEPKPVQKPHPPILIGGSGKKIVLPIVAKYAQMWHFGIPSKEPAEVKQFTAAFDDLCRSLGRNPAEVVKATSFFVPNTEQTAKDVRALLPGLIAAGITYFVLLPPADNNVGLLQKFAREFFPEFRR